MVVISEQERKERENDYRFFKSGKPKKQYMLCKTREYISEVTRINGYCDPDWICGGNRCELYGRCDNRGEDWEVEDGNVD